MTDYRKSLPALAMSDSSLLPPYSVNSSLSSEDLRADAESLSSQGSLDRQHSGGHRHDYSYNQTNLSASRSKSGSTDMLPDKPKKEKSGLLSRFKSRSRELLDDSPKHQTVSPQTSQVVSLEEFLEESRYRESTDTDCGPVFEGPPDDTGRMPSKNSDMDGQNDLSRDRSPTQQSHLTSSFKSDTSQQSEFVVNISGANYTSTPTSSRSEYPAGRSDSLRSLKRMAPPPPPPPSNQQRSTGPSPAGRSRQPIGGNIPIMKDNSPRDYSAPTNRTTYDRPKNLAGDVGRYRNGTDSPNDMYSSTQSPTGSTRDRRQAPTTAPMATPSPQNSNIARPRPRPPNRPNDEQPSPGGAAPAGGSGAAGPREGMTKEQSVWYEYGCV
uniref:Serine/arginine repetitive matrix protein 1-like n=1 Tax=Saccoglossus kowalevskii TaxID=10224 RepID=A0ABM0LWQ9_SACKO|nr:PREDICTED: serine/arginine repetitive matrix protein 1-like [Saccoglossus kowalevskii]